MDVTGTKVYLQSARYVLATIGDVVELQKGKVTYSDTPNGRICFTVKMYAYKWEFSFTVTDAGQNRCSVTIEAGGEELARDRMIRREFSLLDSLLIAGAEIEIAEKTKAGGEQ
jgi:hypothetical protein